MPKTLVLSRADVEALLDHQALLNAVRNGFSSLATTPSGIDGQRIPLPLPRPAPTDSNVMLLAPGLIPGVPAYTVKVHAKFPGSQPAIQGVIVLHSLDDGRVLAIIESSYLTSERTAASGAVGADVLARPDSSVASIIGCGAQGRAQLEWLVRVRPIRRAVVYDNDPERADVFAREESLRLNIDVSPAASAREAAGEADVIVTATWAQEPFLFVGDVKPGAHITTLGPDQPGKCEIEADLIKSARFFADNATLQSEMGAIGGAGLGPDSISAEIGDVLAGRSDGRQSDSEVTVYGSVGLPFQDLAAAWLVYEEANQRGLGMSIDLLSLGADNI